MAITPISADLLLSWATLKSGAGATVSATGAKPAAPVKAPWDDSKNLTPASQLVSIALSGRAFFDASTKAFSQAGASGDDRKLFALHAGLNRLAALAGRFDQKGVTTGEQQRLAAAFDSGLRQLDSFLAASKFDAFSIVRGAKLSEAKSDAGVAGTRRDYLTGVVARGLRDTANAAFAGDFRFTMDVADTHDAATSIAVDLADMTQPRTLDNVINFLNGKLRAAGLTTAFSAVKQGATNGQDNWALNLKTVSGEKISFSAPDAAAALYVGGAGALTKIADPGGGVATSTLNANNVAFSKALASAGSLGAVRASVAAGDGAIYVLADATAKIDGQPIKGAGDVALQKYDSAGNLMFTRTLGAAAEADGFSLAVDADGRVAVAGALSGALGDGQGAASGRDSFLAVYDEDGVEQWVVRSKASADEEARGVAFGPGGKVFVAGREKDASGLWQGSLTSYSAAGVKTATQALGAVDSGANQSIVVQDVAGVARVTVGAVESGKLVLRQFDDAGASFAVGAVRDLGPLAGGALAGLALDGGALYVAGDAKAALGMGNVARAYGGGQDGFVIKLADDLAASGGDWISYVGGAGEDHLAGFAVSGGEVWLGGDSSAAFAGQTTLKDRDGFAARLDSAGALAWSQRFAGAAKQFNAATFAFDASGVTALDRLGLPRGAPAQTDVSDLVSRTALRAGDEFSISINGRSPQIVKIMAGDTLQILADRVEKILLSDGAASVVLSTTEGDKLRIAASAGDRIELRAGPSGKNALAGLGLAEGVVIADPSGKIEKKKASPIYGLGLSGALSLADKPSRKLAVDQLGVALTAVQKAFRDLTAPKTTPAATGTVPDYMKAQLANYQAALARLQSMTGG